MLSHDRNSINQDKFFFPEFVDYKDAIRRLENIKKSLSEALSKEKTFETLPLWGMRLALGAQIGALKKLNSEVLNVPVPFDRLTNLPSLATLAADAKTYSDFLPANDCARILLNSFGGWALFCRETVLCSCGRNVWKPREIAYSVLIYHAFSQKEDEVAVKLFAAVRAEKKHITRHYHVYRPSKTLDESNIVGIFENTLKYRPDEGKVTLLEKKRDAASELYPSDEEFEFGNRYINTVKNSSF